MVFYLLKLEEQAVLFFMLMKKPNFVIKKRINCMLQDFPVILHDNELQERSSERRKSEKRDSEKRNR